MQTHTPETPSPSTHSLARFLAEHPRVAVALSGGVDSTLLLHEARAAGCSVRAYFASSAFQPAFEEADARKVADREGVELTVVPIDVLGIPEVAANGPQRCYHCKRALFEAIAQAAARDGFPLIVDGTNASDDADDRPGMRALDELGVRSPLRECGIAKAQVRELAREAGIPTWNKPSYACLATRIPCGEPLTVDALRTTDHAEDALRKLGFSDFRVRRFHGCARVQVREEQLALACALHDEVLAALRPCYDGVLIDLEARTDE